ncbi:argonaute 1 [Actinomortierella wolfii]|nr:argonaute 1 [Actinomortierella wolfii]
MNITPFVRRPSLGTKGVQTEVRSNFFEVIQLPDGLIYHYDVSITPETPPSVNRKVFTSLIELFLDSDFNNIRPFFDGRRNMFTPKELPFEQRILDVPDFGPRRTDREGHPIVKPFKVRIKLVSRINLYELGEFLRGRISLTNNVLACIMALDILIRHKPAMLYPSIGRSFYVPDTKYPISGGLDIWQGYYQSARPTKNKMLICVDLSGAVFFPDGPLLDFVLKNLGLKFDDVRRPIQPVVWQRVVKLLKGLRITVTHRPRLARPYKIMRLSSTSARDTFFNVTRPLPGATPDAEGNYNADDVEEVPTSVLQYFKEKYDITIKYPYLPCVGVGKSAWVPLELCNLVAGQRYIRKLDERQTDDMLECMSQNPSDRANRIREGVQLLDYEGNEYLREIGLAISKDMVKVNARILPTPVVCYHSRSAQSNLKPKDGIWNLRFSKLFLGAELRSWGIAAMGNERDMPLQKINAFLRQFDDAFKGSGMELQAKFPPIRHISPHSEIEREMIEFYRDVELKFKQRPQLFLVLLPNRGIPLYAEVKRVADTELGIATQCLQYAHVNRPNIHVLSNVCLKVNAKLGGTNATILRDMMSHFDRPIIILGADVSHPAPGEADRPSIATVVGSMDKYASRYATAIRIQAAKTELIADMEGMITELLWTFFKSTKSQPEKILFYRDGVSEGQFEEVVKTEVGAIKNACRRLREDYKPKLTFVVIQKRHHARFFPIRERDMDKFKNCKAGTVVEEGITHPTEFDFYLQSHAGGVKGTTRPTHYHVLVDEIGFSPDQLQTLSFNLCHLHARCTRAVSLVPSAYYAHLVAARARYHFKKKFGDTSSSSTGSETGATRGLDTEAMLRSFANLHDELKNVMWYI